MLTRLAIARLGGDEFGVILTGARAVVDATLAVERINSDLAERVRHRERPYPVSVSAGVAAASGSSFSLHQLLRDADVAMYENKRQRQRLGDEAQG